MIQKSARDNFLTLPKSNLSTTSSSLLKRTKRSTTEYTLGLNLSNNTKQNSLSRLPTTSPPWGGKAAPKQEVVSITYEEIGLFPRSFSRVLDRFLKQVFSDVENLVIQEYRFYRYLFLTTLKCLFILFFVPFIVNFLAKSYVVRPLTEYFWNTKQTEIFLNSYQQKHAFAELKDFEEKLYFESLIYPKSISQPEIGEHTKSSPFLPPVGGDPGRASTREGRADLFSTAPLNEGRVLSVSGDSLIGARQLDANNLPTQIPTQRTAPYDKSDQSTPLKKQTAHSSETESLPLGKVKGGGFHPENKAAVVISDLDGSADPSKTKKTTTSNISTHVLDSRGSLVDASQESSYPQSLVGLASRSLDLDLSNKQGVKNRDTITSKTDTQTSKTSLLVYQTIEADKNIQQRYQEKTIELAQRYNDQSVEAITNFFGDVVSLVTLFYLLYVLEIQINITQSFLLEVFFGLDDSKKSLLILLVTDLLVGYHSSNLWELFFELFFNHYGLPESQTGIFLLVATLPVLLDVLFKYLIFRHLNRSSPATVATYHAIIE